MNKSVFYHYVVRMSLISDNSNNFGVIRIVIITRCIVDISVEEMGVESKGTWRKLLGPKLYYHKY